MKVICINKNENDNNAFLEEVSKINYVEVVGTFLSESAATDFLEDNYVDVVFLGMEKVEAIRDSIISAKKSFNQYLMMAVIAEDEASALKAYDLDIDGYLRKPYTEEQLTSLIARLLNSKKDVKPINVSINGELSVTTKRKTLLFEREKVEQFMVYLLYKKETTLTKETVIQDIYGKNISEIKKNVLYKQLCFSLKEICESAEVGELFTYNDNECTFKYQMIDCDYYNYLDNEPIDFSLDYLSKFKWAKVKNNVKAKI